MKRIIMAVACVLGICGNTLAREYHLAYQLATCDESWMAFDKNGPEDCGYDECYVNHECYDDEGLSNDYEDNNVYNGYCVDLCGSGMFPGTYMLYCEEPGKQRIPLGCGCYLDETTEWRAYSTGRERKYTIKPTDCEGNKTTTATNEYRCAAGYYGNGTTCTRCPSVKNSAGTTVYGNSPAGATSRTQCQLPVGTYTDATGTFTLSAPCAYN